MVKEDGVLARLTSYDAPAHPWDGYLVGPENSLAHAGALALARGEIDGISPLVVHGPSGSGKSRLLNEMVSERTRRRPESAVAHVEAEIFAAACAQASSSIDGWAEIRRRFRGVDLFVLDDLHALDRAPWALEELAHTLDALEARGAAVAVTARTGPGQWSGWPKRLVDRLAAGLSSRLELPSLASRRRYLLDRARAKGLKLPADVVEPLAEAADGYRTLDGWLARVNLATRVHQERADGRMAASILAGDPVGEAPAIEEIARAVSAKFGVPLRDLRSATRRATVVEARHLAMQLSRSHAGASVRGIGAYFGGRDAATVRHAFRSAQARVASDPALASAVEALARGWVRDDN